jgi:hypothetical protein
VRAHTVSRLKMEVNLITDTTVSAHSYRCGDARLRSVSAAHRQFPGGMPGVRTFIHMSSDYLFLSFAELAIGFSQAPSGHLLTTGDAGNRP